MRVLSASFEALNRVGRIGQWPGFAEFARPRGPPRCRIAESVAGRRRIVRHVGSGRDEAELGLLVEEAHRLLADDQQGMLDLGITPVVPKATMVAPSIQAGLFANTAAAPPSRQLVSRPRVLKTSSRPLDDALAGVYASLGFDVVHDEVFRDLVDHARVEPTSLLDVDRVLAEMGRGSASLSTRKRTLRRPHAGTYSRPDRDRLPQTELSTSCRAWARQTSTPRSGQAQNRAVGLQIET